MPTYDMECTACGLTFEIFRQHLLTEDERTCPGCESTHVRQLLTGFVTSRPRRDRVEPTVRGFGGHACGAGCGCNRARVSPSGEIIPP